MIDILLDGELTIVGRHTQASNAVFVVECRLGEQQCRAVYKPSAGERPLWDFPGAVLGRREVAAYEVARACGFGFIPPTVWREDAPLGSGSLQYWIEDADVLDVAVLPELPANWKHVLDAELTDGTAVVVGHADTQELRALAMFDAIVNNADRKAGHILRNANGELWAVDHGVTFHTEPKLRTVLWGFSGEPIPEELLSAIPTEIAELPAIGVALSDDERAALSDRITMLRTEGVYPEPSPDWPAIPWPIF